MLLVRRCPVLAPLGRGFCVSLRFSILNGCPVMRMVPRSGCSVLAPLERGVLCFITILNTGWVSRNADGPTKRVPRPSSASAGVCPCNDWSLVSAHRFSGGEGVPHFRAPEIISQNGWDEDADFH